MQLFLSLPNHYMLIFNACNQLKNNTFYNTVRFQPGEPAQKDNSLSNDEKLCKSMTYTAFFISTKSSERQEKANFNPVLVTIWLQKNFCNFL